MCIASTWTGLGVRTSGPDHWTRGTFRTRPFPYHSSCLLHQPNVLNILDDARAQMTAVAGMQAVMPLLAQILRHGSSVSSLIEFIIAQSSWMMIDMR